MNIKKSNRIAVIGIVGIPAQYGGFETLVEHLCDGSHNFDVYCSSKSYADRLKNYKGAKLWYVPLRANGPQSVIFDIYSIFHALIHGYKSLLVLGVSGAIIFPIIKFFVPSVRLVTNIDGMEWKRDKWGCLQKAFLKFSESLAVNYSDGVIADNQAIIKYVREKYSVEAHLIEYGGDHCIPVEINNVDNEYAFLVCRIEPENNLHIILHAFSRANIKLVIVGNWKSSQYGTNLRAKYSQYKNLDLMDPIYDQKILDKMRSGCEFYVHGHSAGGTNPSLVEMMHFLKPIIAFDCVYNRETLENNGLYFKSDNDLFKILINKSWKDLDTSSIYEIAARRYSWKIIKGKYNSLFNDGKVFL